jgi:quinol monooxygenase YgiN
MESFAVFVRLQSKAGKEAELERLLNEGLSMVQDEPKIIAWYAMRLGPSSFGIIGTFPDEDGRQEYLSGGVSAALMEKSSELLAHRPVIELMSVLGEKTPAYSR